MNKPHQDGDSLNRTFHGVLTFAQVAGEEFASRLLELRGGVFCPHDRDLIELELRNRFVDSHLPALLALDALTLSTLYGLAARAGMRRAIELRDQDLTFTESSTFFIPAEESVTNG